MLKKEKFHLNYTKMELIKHILNIIILIDLCVSFSYSIEQNENNADLIIDSKIKQFASPSYDQYYYPTEEESDYINKISANRITEDNFDFAMDDVDFENDSENNSNNNGNNANANAFYKKEQQIRKALQKSTNNMKFRKHLTEILPIIRALTKEQRLTLAAIISAQITAIPGFELTLQQVHAN